jgi:hypothetical protein
MAAWGYTVTSRLVHINISLWFEEDDDARQKAAAELRREAAADLARWCNQAYCELVHGQTLLEAWRLANEDSDGLGKEDWPLMTEVEHG